MCARSGSLARRVLVSGVIALAGNSRPLKASATTTQLASDPRLSSSRKIQNSNRIIRIATLVSFVVAHQFIGRNSGRVPLGRHVNKDDLREL